MSISEKICVITGANSGLGLATAKRFAALGGHVVLLCRNRQKGEQTILAIQQETPKGSVELLQCDLASMESVQDCVQRFKANHQTLDILFNNAAVMKQRRTLTKDGLEMMFQVNYLAPVFLMTALRDVLQRSAPARILNLALPGKNVRLDFDDLQALKRYSAFQVFFRSKLALLLFSLELSQRLKDTGVTVNCTDPGPGPFKSNLVREAPWPVGWLKNLFSAPVEKAVENIVFLASSEEVRSTTGKIFKGRQTTPCTPYWNDASLREHLWHVTQSFLDTSSDSVPMGAILQRST